MDTLPNDQIDERGEQVEEKARQVGVDLSSLKVFSYDKNPKTPIVLW